MNSTLEGISGCALEIAERRSDLLLLVVISTEFSPRFMSQSLDSILKELSTALAQASSEPEVLKVKANFIGKDGKISQQLKLLKDLPPDQKRSFGAEVNQAKTKAELLIEERLQQAVKARVNKELLGGRVDLGLRDSILEGGLKSAGYHPLVSILRELEDIFLYMGFDVLDGPHIEDDWHNFEALNVSRDHPARDMQDTFWFHDNQHVLRTHTSCIQIRGMESRKPPFRFVGPGSVFRCERTDASHEMTFFQFEGMLVDRNISIAHLIYFAQQLYSSLFHHTVEVRTRPSYFPFVEPGLEIDMKCLMCAEKGCPVCGYSGWVELLGAGLVHPRVLTNGGINPEEYSGFAFGLGVDRLLMMRHGIEDIRHLRSGDLRFVSQFRSI